MKIASNASEEHDEGCKQGGTEKQDQRASAQGHEGRRGDDYLSGEAGCLDDTLSEEDLEDFVLEHSPKIRKMIAEAGADRKAGGSCRWKTYLAGQRTR